MKLLYKELTLSSSPLSYFFLIASVLTIVPGYPILCGAFFITLGIFYSFQTMRENNDIAYSLLLPVSKTDIVRSKFCFALFIEVCGFLPMTVFTLIRMLFFTDAAVYTSNALMCANLTFLGFVLWIFGLFNFVFIGGFFKTAYYFGKPFILYCVVSFFVIALAETLHHIPGWEEFNAFGFDRPLLQSAVLLTGLCAFAALTLLGLKKSERAMKRIDL